MALKLGLLGRRISIEWSVMRWMCGVRLQGRVFNVELRRRLGIKGIIEEMRISRLALFGHMERMDDQNWVKR